MISHTDPQSWIQRLPNLKLLKDISGKPLTFNQAFKKNDILMGVGNIYGVGKYYKGLPGGEKDDKYDYNKWLGRWVGYEDVIYLEGSNAAAPKRHGAQFMPSLAKTNEEQQFLRTVMGSRYNFHLRKCAGTEHCHIRTARASKALVEFALFHKDIRKIHFVLDGLTPSVSIITWKMCDGKMLEEFTKNCSYTHHELRHLHRLALLFPTLVSEKVICWFGYKQVQLPAKQNPDEWKIWTPRLKKTKPPYAKPSFDSNE